MIWTLWILIKSLFKKKEINKSPKFKVGDLVLIKDFNCEGIILEISGTLDIDIYQIEYYPTKDHERDGFSHIQYFFEKDLDIPLREKRDRILKELGI